jgi:hypothetical protein
MSPISRQDNPVALASAFWAGLHLSPLKAIRHELITTLIAELHESLTNTNVSDTEAYAVFVRTVSLLHVYVAKEERR